MRAKRGQLFRGGEPGSPTSRGPPAAEDGGPAAAHSRLATPAAPADGGCHGGGGGAFTVLGAHVCGCPSRETLGPAGRSAAPGGGAASRSASEPGSWL